MTVEENYINAKIQLEFLIKKLDSGKNVDAELVSVSNIIEEYEENNFPID
ncbi:hypothetical protein [Polaribacter sp. ALD11]|nr:hypothetical protein [Polaribacter sp. ALD11]